MPGCDEPTEEALSTLFDSFEIVTTSPQSESREVLDAR